MFYRFSICTNSKLYVSVYLLKNTPVMHLRQPGFTYSVCGPFTKKTKKEYKNSKKQKIHDIFMKTNWIKLVFKMTWLMEILIFKRTRTVKEQLLIKHLILLKIQNMDVAVDLLQWFINFLIKNLNWLQINLLQVEQLKMKLCLIKN